MVVLLSPFAYSYERKSDQTQKAAVQGDVTIEVSPEEQEAFRKKLAELKIPLYKGAVFVEMKKKSKGSPLIYAVYDVPDTGPKAFEDVRNFYAAALRKTLRKQGWVRDPSAKNIHAYRKGFELIYMDFAKVIMLPDTNKIRITFHYGQ